MIVLGVDPGAGKRTGVAVVETAGDRLLDCRTIEAGLLADYVKFHVRGVLDRRRHDVVAVVEAETSRRYTLRYHAWGSRINAEVAGKCVGILEALGYRVERIGVPAKVSSEPLLWRQYWGWKGRVSVHARTAAEIARKWWMETGRNKSRKGGGNVYRAG